MVRALKGGELPPAGLPDPERALLVYVELVTNRANRTTKEDVDRVRAAGWSDEQIAEAVYITALFAFFNRVADAFGLEDPGYDKIAPPLANK